jgi:arginase family enzyme
LYHSNPCGYLRQPLDFKPAESDADVVIGLLFDAHTDNAKAVIRYDHGTMFYDALRERFIDVEHSMQIAIRTE